jgi:hypothetical protein
MKRRDRELENKFWTSIAIAVGVLMIGMLVLCTNASAADCAKAPVELRGADLKEQT